MWNVKDLFILSDIHLAAEREIGFFQADIELADCLRWILTETRDSLTVLAGDMLDFLVPNHEDTKIGLGGLGDQTREIIDYHPEIFETLVELAQSPRHQLVIMGGDHDSDLIFPTVQEAVEHSLGLDFITPTIRWLVQGEALRLRVGKAVVLIEHGNVLDPWNRIDYTTLQSAFSLASCNLLDLLDRNDYQTPMPLGRKLVLEVINKLRDRYRWINCLKPETEVLLPLLWHFALEKQQETILNLAEEYLSRKEFARKEKQGNLGKAERLYKGGKESDDSSNEQAFEAWNTIAHEQPKSSLGKEARDNKLIEQLRLISAQDTFLEIDKPDNSVVYLRSRFNAGADLVIHGHTHSAKACSVEGGFYLNTGTWGQLMQLPKSDESGTVWQSFLDGLRTNDVQSFRRPTLARVQHREEQNVTTSALLEWQQPGPKTLVERRFSDRLTGWRKEN